MNLIWTIQDSFDAAVEGVRNIIQLVNMISQVQTAMKSIGTPCSARKAYQILTK
jgi:hypothetical protein